MIRSIVSPLLVVLLGVSSSIASGERDELPLGHPDFHPSPERPIGWRGDGSGAFPGAAVVDAFGDGPVKQHACQEMSHGKPKDIKVPYVDHDGGAKNIAWKVPLPGFTMSQPIVVGDRAIQTCEPRTILCLDMKTGEELWRQELDPFRMIGIDGAEREEALLLESTAWVLHALSKNLVGNYTRLYGKDSPAFRKRIGDQAARMRSVVEQVKGTFPEQAKATLAGLDAIDQVLADTATEIEENNKGKQKSIMQKALASAHAPFSKLFQSRYQFPATLHWYSYIGWTWPTPVCDGEWLYVTMGQGQVARLKVADGSIGWFRKLADPIYDKQPHPRSPLLHAGVMIIAFSQALYGLEAGTGKELWKVDLPSLSDTAGLGPTLMHLSSDRTVVAAWNGSKGIFFIDPADGKTLGTIDTKKGAHDPGPCLMAEGDFLVAAWTGKTFRVSEQDGAVTAEELWSYKKPHGGNVQVVFDGFVYTDDGKQASKYGLATGKPVDVGKNAKFGIGQWKPGILVGDRLVGCTHSVQDSNRPRKIGGLWRKPAEFLVVGLDGKKVSDQNWLEVTSGRGAAETVPQAARFITEDLNGEHLADICAGLPTVFSYAGLYAHGNRVLIPSVTHLYCIGDPAQPYNGKPGPAE